MTFHLPSALSTNDDAQALRHLRTYYGKADRGQYTGAYFDEWALDQDPYRFSAEDVVAVSFLSVFVPPMAAHRLLVTDVDRFSQLLREVGPDRDLATEAVTVDGAWPARRLYAALLALPGVGPTTASKLCARKRPRLVPIYDSVVAQVTDGRASYWEPLRIELRRPGSDLHARLVRLGEDTGLENHISAIRIFDVVTWMEGKSRSVPAATDEERVGAVLAGPDQ